MNLKMKFLLPALALILVGMAATTFVTYSKSTSTLVGLAKQKADGDLHSLLSLVDEWVGGTQNEIITISNVDIMAKAVSGGSDSALAMDGALALLRDVAKRNPALQSILIINSQGIVVADSLNNLTGKNLGAEHISSRPFWGKTSFQTH